VQRDLLVGNAPRWLEPRDLFPRRHLVAHLLCALANYRHEVGAENLRMGEFLGDEYAAAPHLRHWLGQKRLERFRCGPAHVSTLDDEMEKRPRAHVCSVEPA